MYSRAILKKLKLLYSIIIGIFLNLKGLEFRITKNLSLKMEKEKIVESNFCTAIYCTILLPSVHTCLLSETFGKEHSQRKMQPTGGFRMLLYKHFVIFCGKKLELTFHFYSLWSV
jgi:hypothetical protein